MLSGGEAQDQTETCFNNDKSCERIIYAVFSHLNNGWKGRSLLESTH